MWRANQQNEAKSTYGPLLGLAAATFLFHLAFGVYYATHAENLTARPTLRQRGDEFLSGFPSWNSEHEADSALYNREALGVLQTGLPRNRHGKLSPYGSVYAYFLAACYRLGGIRLLSVAIPQAMLSGLTCLLIGLTAGQAAQQHRAGAAFIGAEMMFLNLRVAMYTAYMSPTILVLFWFSLALFLIARIPANPAPLWLALVLGVAMHTESAFLILGLTAALWLLADAARTRSLGRLFAGLGVILVAGTSVLAVRATAAASDDAAEKSAISVLWEANNPYYESMRLTSLWERRPYNPWTHWSVTATEQKRFDEYRERAKRLRTDSGLLWVRENPAQYATLCLIRLRTTLGPFTGMMSPRNRIISTFYWLLIFPAGFCGVWKCRQHSLAQFAALAILVQVGFESLVITEWYLRYRFPVDLLLTVFAAIAYTDWVGSLSRRLRRQVALTEAVAPEEMSPPPSILP